MGSACWVYFAPYQEDVSQALHDLQREVAERNGSNGTHSILDIKSVGEYQMFETVSPLTKNEYFFLFGTDRPDQATVERVEQELYHLRDDGIGSYIVVYEDRQPSAYCFFDCTENSAIT